MDVAVWLEGLGLGQYTRSFADNAVDAELLATLTADDLKELGIVAVGHRRRLLEAIASLRPVAASEFVVHRASEGERRQVYVLFADLAGYTALAREIDAEEVLTLLEAFFRRVDQLIVDHGGHIDKHIGDCVMAVFGAPVAFGNDAARAVSAAIAIRDAMPGLAVATGRSLAVHVGVAGGQVVAGGTGSTTHREYTVTGDTVNLASKLTDAAAPGDILISHSVRSELGSRLEATEIGQLAVKGLAEPVRSWRVEGFRTLRADRALLVGRRGELSQLESFVIDVARRRAGRAVLLRGEAGIGKTRLIEEVQRLAAAHTLSCHTAWALDFGAAIGRDPIRVLLRSLLRLDGENDSAAAVSRVVGEGWIAEESLVFLNDLLDVPQPSTLRALYEAMDNAHRNAGKRAVMVRLLERASELQPMLLIVEDVHWADQISLAHLARLAAASNECPCLLLITTRLDGDPIDRAWRAQTEGVSLTTIDLGPLRPNEARLMAQSILAGSAELAERCVQRAAGNPLFLEQLARLGQETESAAMVPSTVQSLVQARLDRLSATDKTALQAAAVFGQRFDPAALDFVLDRPSYDPAPLVDRLLLHPDEGSSLRFAHALVRDAVYDSLLRARRRELHQRAAAWFAERDLVLRAEHLDRARAPEAAAAYLDAARSQLAEYRSERARELLQRGLKVAHGQSDMVALSCLLGQTLLELGLFQEASQSFSEALKLAVSDTDRCEAWLGLAACKRMTDDLSGAEVHIDCAHATATRLDLTDILARSHFLAGNLCFPRGDIEGCLHHHGRSLAFAQACGSAEREAAALGGLGDAEYVRGRMASAQNYFEQCLDLCQEHGLGRIAAAHRQMLGLTRFFGGDVRGALADAIATADAARHRGQPRGEMVAHMIAAEMCANLMQFEDAMAHLAEVDRLIHRLGAARFEPLRLNCLAKTLRASGRHAEALPLLRQSVEASRATSLAFSGPSSLGALALTTNDPVERRRAIEEGEQLLSGGSVAHNHFRFYRDTIDATLRVKEWQEAVRLANALEAFAIAEPLPWTTFYVARGRVLAVWGSTQQSAPIRVELNRLAEQGRTAGLLLALPAIECALAA